MSKITRALQKAKEERAGAITPAQERAKDFVKHTRGDKMRKTWFTWAICITVVGSVFFAFNYQGGRDAVPLSEIFPDDDAIEYEFVEDERATSKVEEVAVTVVVEEKEDLTRQVAVKAPPKQKVSIKTAIATPRNPGNYTVQIASFKNQERADEALVKIRTKVPSAYVSSQDLGAKGVWYRIYAGQYRLRSEAEVSLNDIQQNYDSSFIISSIKSK